MIASRAVDHDPGPRIRHLGPALTTDAERARQAALADLVAAIERAAVDLGLAEEPSGFAAALDAGAPRARAGAAPRRSHRVADETLAALAAKIRAREISPVEVDGGVPRPHRDARAAAPRLRPRRRRGARSGRRGSARPR